MGRTVSELTEAELRAYRPVTRQEPEAAERWVRAWDTARAAANLLRQQFGASRVVAFGSLLHRLGFTVWSDIDLAAWDIPASEFYRAVAAVAGFSSEFKIDLLDPEACPPRLRQRIEREGAEL
jgi:predicted nucleotidyltransferase